MTPAVLWTLLTVLLVLNTALVGYWAFILYDYNKKKTYAVLLYPDRTRPVVKRVDTSKAVFKHKARSYVVTEPYIRHDNKKYLLYDIRGSDPIDPLDKANSRVGSEELHAILENEALKALNKPPLGLNLDNPVVKWGLIIIGGAIAYYAFGGA